MEIYKNDCEDDKSYVLINEIQQQQEEDIIAEEKKIEKAEKAEKAEEKTIEEIKEEKIVKLAKVIKSLSNDLIDTFPEYKLIIQKTNTIMSIEDLYEYYSSIFKIYNKEFASKDKKIFDNLSTFNTEFFPGVSFRYLWNFQDITDNTREIIWCYLQTIYFIITGDNKFEHLVYNYQDILQNIQSQVPQPTTHNEETELNNLFNGIFGGNKIGNIAKEIASESSELFANEFKNCSNSGELMQKMFKNPVKLMSMVNKISTKLQEGFENTNEEELKQETENILGSFKNSNNPTLSSLANIIDNFKSNPAMQDNSKMNYEAMANELMASISNSSQPSQPSQPSQLQPPIETPKPAKKKSKSKK
jgi:hypothetical protein